MSMSNKITPFISAAAAAAFFAAPALAESIGKPIHGGMALQPAATSLARDVHFLDSLVNWIIGGIVILVVTLLVIVIFRFSAKRNPVPARFTHHAALEIAWTGIPIAILMVIGAFSLPVLYNQLTIPDAEVTLKATGNQWYWSYDYPDEEISFDALMLQKDELEENGYAADEYLLAADTAVVVPVDTNVHVLVTASDVIHSWAMPAFGVKMDAVPGRLNEFWFNADTIGTYFGQCSELCGENHAYMPITVKVVSAEDYQAWLETTRLAQGLPPRADIKIAAAE